MKTLLSPAEYEAFEAIIRRTLDEIPSTSDQMATKAVLERLLHAARRAAEVTNGTVANG